MDGRGSIRLAMMAAAVAVAGACGNGLGSASPPIQDASASFPPTCAGCGFGAANDWTRWYVGLSSGNSVAQVAQLQKVVADYNQQQLARSNGGRADLLSLEIVDNGAAAGTLQTEIESGHSPDVIGPNGVGDLAGFAGQLADLRPLASAAGFATSPYPARLLEAVTDSRTGALVGLPYTVDPSYIVYNRALFDAAGLEYPPQKVGEPYTMPDGTTLPWNWNTVRTIGLRLSLDRTGTNATQSGFDPASQIQFGFDLQNPDGLELGSAFGAGSLVASDGKTAQFSDAWNAAWSWYYRGIWTDHFIPTAAERRSDLLNLNNPFSSGHVAMALAHQSYIGSMSAGTIEGSLKSWDLAVMPANGQGVTTAPLGVESLGVATNSTNPGQAFKEVAYIATRSDLTSLFGVPVTADQTAFFHDNVDPAVEKQFRGDSVNWQVAIDMESYGDSPSHSYMPNYYAAAGACATTFRGLAATPNLDMNVVATQLVSVLQSDFNAGP
jgi:multiple sugar transport system substrate-binding protein